MNAHDVVQQARKANLRLVRFQYCDNGGIIRCKSTHVSRLHSRLQEGIGQTHAMGAWTGVESLAPVENMGAIGEFRLIPDPATFTILPYVPNTGAMMCNQIRLDGAPWEADPRSFLIRMIERLAKQGMRAEAAVEHEFYLARRQGDGYVPADHSLCYSTTGLDDQAEVIDTILATLEGQGIGIEQFHTELGPSQQELSLRHTDILRSADNVCFARETIRGVAHKYDLIATFTPKPYMDQIGSGAHIHFSLWGTPTSEQPNQNLFHDGHERGSLSQLGKYFIGGVLRHIRGLVAITCGSVNSYSRLLPHFWSSAYDAWGFDNREGVVRVPSTYWGRESESTNIELKAADHSGNPYLSMGAMLAAGLDGINNKIDPGQPLDVDPGNFSDTERERYNIHRLPTTFGEALDALEHDSVLMEALGPIHAHAYLAVKRNEVEFFNGKTPEEVALQHFYKF